MHRIDTTFFLVFTYDFMGIKPHVAMVNSPPSSAVFVPLPQIKKLQCSTHRHVCIWNMWMSPYHTSASLKDLAFGEADGQPEGKCNGYGYTFPRWLTHQC